ncbi:5-hydroxytryptamine receptor 3A-like isoform X1 [Poecilia formosa]|uniref:5-hydroxytryptamine receptor 3A-like isoform X1 n=1 Tax=Poecilia formosa TaxID=48698 RepID=UPI0007BAD3B1|nr:PREDICTED: 5-hydroxytryptamine receptor 3A-like isoform X1 [Poecilia formosa]
MRIKDCPSNSRLRKAPEMMHISFFLLVIITGGVSCKVCSYQDVLDYLNLTVDTNVFKMTRPVLDHTHTTVVKTDMILYAILSVVEKTQTFVPFVWVSVQWKDERISWDPAQFCGITEISVPKSILWRPDLFIYEMIEKDDSPQNPYILVSHDGTVFYDEDMRVISTCKMDVHKFPFDTQECSLSIGSAIHCVKEIRIFPFSNSSRATQFSREVMKTQGEWEFLKMSVESANISLYDRRWELLVYKVTIKRRPLLHVINFLLPILFFLILDLASFFIADHRGEKLGFKVTVLLAISVLLLILNDILPSMSNKTPLIATYCIVIFALMLLSLLETILVTYLIDKDSEDELGLCDSGEEKNKQMKTKDCSTEIKKQNGCSCSHRVCEGEKQHELLTVDDEVNNSDHSRDASALLSELKKLQNMMHQHFGPREERVKSVFWARRINRLFFIFYVLTVLLFLSFILMEWYS